MSQNFYCEYYVAGYSSIDLLTNSYCFKHYNEAIMVNDIYFIMICK